MRRARGALDYVIRDEFGGDVTTCGEWFGVAVDIPQLITTTHQQVTSITGIAALLERFPTSHLGDEEGSDESETTHDAKYFVVHHCEV